MKEEKQVMQQDDAKKILSGFGKRLAEKRMDAGYSTFESLAIKMGIEKSTVYRWEQGVSMPKYETLLIIADLLNTSCQYLLTDQDIEHASASQKYGLSNQALKVLEELNVKRSVYPPSGPIDIPKIQPVDLINALLVCKSPIDWRSAVELVKESTKKNREQLLQLYNNAQNHSTNWIESIAEDVLMLAEQINAFTPAKSSALVSLEKIESAEHELEDFENNESSKKSLEALEDWRNQQIRVYKKLRGYGCYPISENDYFAFQKHLIETELNRLVKVTLENLWEKKDRQGAKEANNGQKSEQ